jgi:fructose-1,6-bisphosphatase I
MSELKKIEDVFFNSCLNISNLLKETNLIDLGKEISVNSSGDNMKKLDYDSNNILFNNLKKLNCIKTIISEEIDEMKLINKNGKYLVGYDPLDGSSNIDSNISVGTIFSVFEYDENDFIKNGKNIVLAGYCIYGPTNIMVIANNENVRLYQYQGKWNLIDIKLLPEQGKIYAINESNKYKYNNYINKYINKLIKKGYTARWVGSLVADVHRTLIKGGVIIYPLNKSSPFGRIRLVYEAYPIAFIFEKLGGKSLSYDNKSILEEDFPYNNIHRKVPIYYFGKKEFELFN